MKQLKASKGEFRLNQVFRNHYEILTAGYWIGRLKGKENAQLFCASKDLYDALQICVEHNKLHFGENHNTVIQGTAALAKARGEVGSNI